MLSEEVSFSRPLRACGWGPEGSVGSVVSACVAEILLAYAACTSVCARGRLALQGHSGYRTFWARLLRVLLLLDGFLVCTVSLKWV